MFEVLEKVYNALKASLNEYLKSFETKGRRSVKLKPVIQSLRVLKEVFESNGWSIKNINELETFLDETIICPSLDRNKKKQINK